VGKEKSGEEYLFPVPQLENVYQVPNFYHFLILLRVKDCENSCNI
jgi:hypothetical protein